MPDRTDEFVELCRAWNCLSRWQKWEIRARVRFANLGIHRQWWWGVLMSVSVMFLVDNAPAAAIAGTLVFCYYMILRRSSAV